MKNKKLLAALVIILIGTRFAYKAYNKEHTDVSTADILEELPASALFSAFDTNEQQAIMQYTEQVLAVSGVVYEIDLSNPNEAQIVLEANGSDGFIRCGFKNKTANLAEIKVGSQLKIKGMCKGMNDAGDLDLLADRDVILSNCIIIE